MTEREKMAAGLPYFPADPELTAARRRAKELCQQSVSYTHLAGPGGDPPQSRPLR